MKKKIFLVVSFIVGISLFLVAFFGSGLENILNVFSKISIKYLGLFFLASLLILIGRTLKWVVILKTKNKDVGFFKLFLCKLTEVSISFLTPMAFMGGGIASSYLLIKSGVKPHLAASSVVLDKSFEMVFNALFTFMGALVLISHFAISKNTQIIIIIGPLILMVGIYLFYRRIMKGGPLFDPVLKLLRLNKLKIVKKHKKEIKKSEEEVIIFFKQYKKDAILALLISLGTWMVMFLEYKLLLLTMGYHVNLVTIFSIIAVVGFAYIIPVPAALGALESGQASLFSLMGLGASVGIVLSLLIRFKDLIITFIGLIYLSFKGLGILKKSI
ncbi:flippase-like domain-containing protein [Candidatus Woesearchaeota archaeon]|nr:flippase-like domain-containing protein [Candidatus Woesearchaeota archaeon]